MIDLHIHSSYSDGSKTPEEILLIAKKNKFHTISITDHNTMDGIKQLKELYTNDKVNIIPGIELDADWNGREAHILGYFMECPELLSEKIIDLKKHRMHEIIQLLKLLNKAGISIAVKDIVARYGSLSINIIISYVIEQGFAKNRDDVINRYMIKNESSYIHKYMWRIEETVRIIKASGGIAILAHPVRLCDVSNLEETIHEAISYGVDGIEVYHSEHSEEYTKLCLKYAKKYSLLVTGGSDYHGNFKPNIKLGMVSEKTYIPDTLMKQPALTAISKKL